MLNVDAMGRELEVHAVPGGKATKKLAKKISRKPERVLEEDPRAALRGLVRQHQALLRAEMANIAMSVDKKRKVDLKDRAGNVVAKKGSTIACALPEDVRRNLAGEKAFGASGSPGGVAGLMREARAAVEKEMTRALKRVPIYQVFLSKVYGIGPVCAAYLVAEIDIARAAKPSSLRMFCGVAVDNGRLVRKRAARWVEDPATGKQVREKGVLNPYNSQLRVILWQAFGSMRKTTYAKAEGVSRQVKTSRYVERWYQAVYGRVHAGRDKGADKAGMWKACELFLDDLYAVWRALEGLPVYCTLIEARRGVLHGGGEPPPGGVYQDVTVDSVLAKIGELGPTPIAPRVWPTKEEIAEEPEG